MKLGYSVKLSAALVAVLMLGFPFGAPAQVIKWQLALGPTVPGSAYQFYQEKEIPRRVKEATGGKLEIVPHMELVKAADVLDAVRDRRVDMGVQGTMYRGDTTLFNYLSLPAIIPFEALPQIHAKAMPILEDEARSKFGVELVGMGYWPRQLLLARRPVATFAELKGLKFRTHSYEILQLMKAVGGAPVSMPYSEVYLALQRGAIDGGVSSMIAFRGSKWVEVATNLNWWPMGNAGYLFVINKDSWNQLPPPMREVVKKTISEAAIETWGKADAEDKQLKDEFATKYKSVSHYPSPAEIEQMKKMMGPVVTEWKQRAGEKGPKVIAIVNEVLHSNY